MDETTIEIAHGMELVCPSEEGASYYLRSQLTGQHSQAFDSKEDALRGYASGSIEWQE